MAEAARAGFKSVVNNRPDHEHGPGQPTSAEIEAAARAAGLEYRFLPVASGYQSPEEIAAFASCSLNCRGRCSCSAAPARVPPGSSSPPRRSEPPAAPGMPGAARVAKSAAFQ